MWPAKGKTNKFNNCHRVLVYLTDQMVMPFAGDGESSGRGNHNVLEMLNLRIFYTSKEICHLVECIRSMRGGKVGKYQNYQMKVRKA